MVLRTEHKQFIDSNVLTTEVSKPRRQRRSRVIDAICLANNTVSCQPCDASVRVSQA